MHIFGYLGLNVAENTASNIQYSTTMSTHDNKDRHQIKESSVTLVRYVIYAI